MRAESIVRAWRAIGSGRWPLKLTVRRHVKHLAHSLPVVLVLIGCGMDVVTSRYGTLAEARADRLFDRGWLPDVLPPSTYDIRTSNDVAQNTSVGEFHFAPTEFALLKARLQPYASSGHPFGRDFERDLHAQIAAGHPAYQFAEGGSTWVFLCNSDAGRCKYTMWLKRS